MGKKRRPPMNRLSDVALDRLLTAHSQPIVPRTDLVVEDSASRDRSADGSAGAASPDILSLRDQLDELRHVQQSTNQALAMLLDAVNVFTASDDPLDVRGQLERLTTAQQRTNQLLELALRAGFDMEERARAAPSPR